MIDIKVDFSEFHFLIKKPSYRVNNSLIIYNFDYDAFLNQSRGVSYRLRKNNDLYFINNRLEVPNFRYLIYYSSEISNIIFDEYIDFDIGYDEGNSSYIIDKSLLNGGFLNLALGFDFNFTYYSEPLVSVNGSYDYVFNKPSYVYMDWSLNPFHIPVLEAVENVFIFLLFYCPIISDILEYLHFNVFMGGLLNIFQMFINSQIGNFVLGCFAFLILWSILKNLLPSVVTSVGSL